MAQLELATRKEYGRYEEEKENPQDICRSATDSKQVSLYESEGLSL